MTTTVFGEKVKPVFNKSLFTWYLQNNFNLVALRGKAPSGEGKLSSRYMTSTGAIKNSTSKGFNTGAVLPPGILVIDIDPRDAGDETARQLIEDLFENSTLPDLIDSTFSVKTGGGGWHLYFSYPAGYKPAGKIEGYKDGIDIKTPGGYVVTPGSVHLTAKKHYEAITDPETMAPLPAELAKLILKELPDPLAPTPRQKKTHPHWGTITTEELQTLLDVLDPRDFKEYLSWLALLFASHHGTAGDVAAMQAFGDWSAKDDDYALEAHHVIKYKWGTARQDRQDEVSELCTVRTLTSKVKEAIKTLAQTRDPERQITPEAIKKANDLTDDIYDRRIAAELESLNNDHEVKDLIEWVQTLPPKWEDDDLSLLPKIIGKIAEQNEVHWAHLASVVAEQLSRKTTPAQILKSIKAHKRQRETEEDPPAKMTHARIVEIAARRALAKIVATPKNLLCPPNNQFYIYRNGVWLAEPIGTVNRACYGELSRFVDLNQGGTKPLPSYTKDATSTLSLQRYTPKTDLYARKELPSCINLKNGTLWFDDNGTTTFKAHDRDDYLTTQLPYDYTPEAICPAFDTMLEQVFDHVRAEYSTKERDELTRHFWELIGYIIQPRKDLPKIMIWTGEGQNGKSRIAQIISRLVGQNAWLSVDLRSFFSKNQPHNSSSLEGKLILVDDDVKSGAVLDDGDLKKVCQSKVLQVNPKNRDPYDVLLQLVPLIITNNRVRLDDTSEGSYRRLDVIEWNTNISHLQDSPLPDLVEAEQMPGVLNKAAQGLSRLRARGQFELPRCVQDYRARFISSSNTALSFWESVDRVGVPGIKHPASRLYTQYIQFMADEGNGRPMRRDEFNDAIRRSGVRINRDYVHDWIVSDFI